MYQITLYNLIDMCVGRLYNIGWCGNTNLIVYDDFPNQIRMGYLDDVNGVTTPHLVYI